MRDPEDKKDEAEAETPDAPPAEEGGGDEPAPEPQAEPVEEAEPGSDAQPAADAEPGTDAEPEIIEPSDEPEIVEPEPVELSVEDELRLSLEQTQSRLRAVSKAFTDSQAEMQAFRGRMENQAKFKAERQAFEQARAFFDPLQNLKRSVENADQGHDALVDGLQIVLNQFMEAMKKLGMEAIPGVGSVFDPRFHEALAITPVQDKEQDGRVLMVHADGYTVNGKVLQAAQVVVAKYQEPAGEA